VSGRGHRAALPPAGFAADPPLAPSGLVVTVVNKAGHEKSFDFAALGVPGPMQRSLAAAFAAQSRRWSGHASADGYWRRLRLFSRFLAGQEDAPEDLDGLTAALLKRWRAAHVGTNDGRHAMAVIRVLLQQDPRLRDGPVADELARRIPSARPSGQSYDEDERERVLLAARRQFRAALLRIRENAGLLQRWQAGELPEGSRESRLGLVLRHLAEAGDVPRVTGPSGHSNVASRGLLGGQQAERTWGRLFLTRMELTALAVLLTDQFGWNLAVYDRMPAPVRTPSAGETATVTYQVQVEKRRRGGGHWFSTENVTDSGAGSAGRLVTQALEATACGRALAARLAPGTDLLMTAHASQPAATTGTWSGRARPGPLSSASPTTTRSCGPGATTWGDPRFCGPGGRRWPARAGRCSTPAAPTRVSTSCRTSTSSAPRGRFSRTAPARPWSRHGRPSSAATWPRSQTRPTRRP
jgi:hypothetical protein